MGWTASDEERISQRFVEEPQTQWREAQQTWLHGSAR